MHLMSTEVQGARVVRVGMSTFLQGIKVAAFQHDSKFPLFVLPAMVASGWEQALHRWATRMYKYTF